MCTIFWFYLTGDTRIKKVYRVESQFLLSNGHKLGHANLTQRTPQVGRLTWCQAASLKNVPTGLLRTKRGGRLWKVVASCPPQWYPGAMRSRHLASNWEMQARQPTTSEAGCQPAPIAQHLCRSQLSRTGFYIPHRYRPLLTRLKHGALKNVPHNDGPDG